MNWWLLWGSKLPEDLAKWEQNFRSGPYQGLKPLLVGSAAARLGYFSGACPDTRPEWQDEDQLLTRTKFSFRQISL
jgi:hypothetical protein